MTIKAGTHVNLSWLFVPATQPAVAIGPAAEWGQLLGSPGQPHSAVALRLVPPLLVSAPALWGSCGASAAVLGKA